MAWHNKKWGKDKICGITFCRLRPGKNYYGLNYVSKLCCGHSFYTKPLIEWTKKSDTCPLCRTKFNVLEDIFGNLIK